MFQSKFWNLEFHDTIKGWEFLYETHRVHMLVSFPSFFKCRHNRNCAIYWEHKIISKKKILFYKSFNCAFTLTFAEEDEISNHFFNQTKLKFHKELNFYCFIRLQINISWSLCLFSNQFKSMLLTLYTPSKLCAYQK